MRRPINASTVARAEATKAYYEAIKEQQNLRIEIAKLRNIATKEKGEVEELETRNALIRDVIVEQIKKIRIGWMNYYFGGR